MSTTTVSVGRYRLPALAVVVALVAAIALAVLALADVTRTGSSREAPATASEYVSTPYWLQRYLEFEAPAAGSVPTPYWLQRYLELEAPASDSADGTRPPNEGLR